MNTQSGTLRLASGRTLRLLRLTQRDIYADIVDGVPCGLVNERIIETERAEAARESGRPPFVIRPIATPLPNPRAEPGELAPARLPSIASRAVFRAAPTPTAQPFEDVSELTIVWFQEQFGWPPDEATGAPLRAVDWDALATNRVFS